MLRRWKLCAEKVRSMREFKFLVSFSCVANMEETLEVLEEKTESKCLTVRNGQKRRSVVCLEVRYLVFHLSLHGLNAFYGRPFLTPNKVVIFTRRLMLDIAKE